MVLIVAGCAKNASNVQATASPSRAQPTETPASAATSGPAGQWHIGGVVKSITGCQNPSDAKGMMGFDEGDGGNVSLAGTKLTADATATPYDHYSGQLNSDGTFRLDSPGHASGQQHAVIAGKRDRNGTFTASWDLPFTGGCVLHIPQATGYLNPA